MYLDVTAQGCILPQAETPTAVLELAKFIHRRLIRTAPAVLLTLLNTSGWPLQAKQALLGQMRPICIHKAMDPVPLLLDSASWEPSITINTRVPLTRFHGLSKGWSTPP